MAVKRACLISTEVRNTGKTCDAVLGATAMLLAVPDALEFTEADLADPVSWLNTQIHAALSTRVYPMFGQKAPIRTLNNSQDADVMVTLDDGLQVFIRYGLAHRIFATTSGGLCYAKALQSFNSSGYRIIEIDQFGKMLVELQVNGKYKGMTTEFMYSPAPILPDLKSTVWQNQFKISYNPLRVVQNGVILDGAEAMLASMGLIDAKITSTGATSTITYLEVNVITECTESDLVALFTTKWNSNTLFAVTNKATGATVTITGVTNVGGKLRLAGTFVVGQTYVVVGTTAAALKAALIEGYEIVDGVEITV
jgi:hypothetical protein